MLSLHKISIRGDKRCRYHGTVTVVAPPRKLHETPEDERNAILEAGWQAGGLGFRESFYDVLPFGSCLFFKGHCQRSGWKCWCRMSFAIAPPIDTEYFETYNRDNVSLVDIRHNPVKRMSALSNTRIVADIF